MDFEGIMLSEISHLEKDKWSYWYVESKTIKLIKTMSRMVVAGGCWGVGKWGEVGQRVQTLS